MLLIFKHALARWNAMFSHITSRKTLDLKNQRMLMIRKNFSSQRNSKLHVRKHRLLLENVLIDKVIENYIFND